MLQSIQYVGSGPPTYIYSKKAVGASGEFYHVFATETREYDSKKEHREREMKIYAKRLEKEVEEIDEFQVIENYKEQSLEEVYKKEYGKRESFLWRQK